MWYLTVDAFNIVPLRDYIIISTSYFRAGGLIGGAVKKKQKISRNLTFIRVVFYLSLRIFLYRYLCVCVFIRGETSLLLRKCEMTATVTRELNWDVNVPRDNKNEYERQYFHIADSFFCYTHTYFLQFNMSTHHHHGRQPVVH